MQISKTLVPHVTLKFSSRDSFFSSKINGQLSGNYILQEKKSSHNGLMGRVDYRPALAIRSDMPKEF